MLYLLTTDHAKTVARGVRSALAADGVEITHSQALEVVARAAGHRDWNTCTAALEDVTHVESVPVLRVTDGQEAIAFYRDYLGFEVDFEHRFAPDLPLYVRVRRGGAALDLSEHHGDGTPGSVAWIETTDVHAFVAELRARQHPRLRPGVEEDGPGGPGTDITDPWGNQLRFSQPSHG